MTTKKKHSESKTDTAAGHNDRGRLMITMDDKQEPGSIGLEFDITKHFSIIADYSYQDGAANFSPLVDDPGRTDIAIQGFSIGAQAVF